MSYPRQSILFISNLDKAANETLLYQLFNEFPVSYIKIAKDHQTRESYGYAFVGFKNHAKGIYRINS
jgi:RNA recognition motif-containing protein